jgi:Kef-type K+ transport system membrane component KefB
VKRGLIFLLIAIPALVIAQPSGAPPAAATTPPTPTPTQSPAAPPIATPPPITAPTTTPPPASPTAVKPPTPPTTTPKPAPKVEHPVAGTNHAKPAEHNGEAENKTKVSSLFAIKVIGGLAALLVLAYLGGNRRVVRFQEQLGISGVITAGFPFVALGALASLPQIGILNHDVLAKLRPVLHFGLGWVGFIIGAQLDIRVLDRVPKGTAYLILVEALGPFGITAAGCGIVMVSFGMSLDDPATWRDMILLGTAAAMTAPRKFRGFANRTWHEGRGVDVLLGQLDELVGVIGLLFITAYFRDDVGATTWQLPNTAWVFVSLGLGVAIGVLIFAMIRVPVSNVEFLAVVLGAIAFASGLAGNLRLSPIVICFIAGVLVTNFPNEQRESIFRILNHLERPVHLLFLMIAGAVWTITDWRGWALVPLFVAGRIIGKWTGIVASKTVVGALLPSAFADQRTLVTPLSGLSIALVISVQSLYHDEGLPWIMTAVIGGAVVAELLVARTPDPVRARTAPVVAIDELDDSGPIDELDDADSDEHEGPIYRDEPPAPTSPTSPGGSK